MSSGSPGPRRRSVLSFRIRAPRFWRFCGRSPRRTPRRRWRQMGVFEPHAHLPSWRSRGGPPRGCLADRRDASWRGRRATTSRRQTRRAGAPAPADGTRPWVEEAPDGALQSGGAAEQAEDGLTNASTSPVATLIRCSRPGCWPARPTPPTVLPQRRLFAVGGSGPSP